MRIRTILAWLPGVILILAWAADRIGAMPDCAQQPVGTRTWTISRVIDGDTLEDACGRRIRVLNVDTPERDTPDGPAATRFTSRWLGPLPTTAQVVICADAPSDRYGRVLARIHRVTDDADLSQSLLSHGQAWPMFIPPCATAQVTSDTRAFERARRRGIGLWARYPTSAVTVREALAQTYPPFVIVRGRVLHVEQHKRYLTIILGHPPDTLHVRVMRRSLPRFQRAGIDLLRLRGQRVTALGKLYRPQKGRPYLYVDFPQLLRLADDPAQRRRNAPPD